MTTAYQAIADALAADVLQGRLAPGDRLPDEAELAQRHGVGRSTIREALRVLTGRGLLRISKGPGGGVFVAALAPEDVGRDLGDGLAFLVGAETITFAELLELREVHESATARLAARRAGPAEIQRLLSLAEQAEELLEDPEAFNDVNVAFHLALAEAARNRLLTLWLHALKQALARAMGRATADPERRLHAARQHRLIADAVAAHDEEAAVAAMGAHLHDFAADYLRAGEAAG